MPPTSSILRTPLGTYELRLLGHFPHPHWVAFLFAGLAQSNVSVISGRAFQNESKDWDTRLGLDFRDSKAVPETLDYIAMAGMKSAVSDMTMPKLTRYEIRQVANGLEVNFQGPDQLGFLGRFLGRVSLLTLYPSDIELNTLSGIMRDRIVFRGMMGTVPGEDVKVALDSMLRGMVNVK